MVFVVVQIKIGVKVLKGLLGLKLTETSTMNDIYNGCASGCLDDGNCISDSYNTINLYRFYFPFIINFGYTSFFIGNLMLSDFLDMLLLSVKLCR